MPLPGSFTVMPDFNDPTHVAGYAFERHVIGLLGKDFRVMSWMGDGARGREEIDFSPDLVVEHLPTGTVIGIECKFRSTLFGGNISWAKEYQPAKYRRFADATGFASSWSSASGAPRRGRSTCIACRYGRPGITC